MKTDEFPEAIRKLEKENIVLKRKLEKSEIHLEQLQGFMDQTLILLKKATDEKITEEEKRRLIMFRKFVPAEFLISLGKERFEDIELGDCVERKMTILFSDIRNFTSHSESLTPKDTFNFINDYLMHLEPAIHLYKGFIDKVIGDAIMALFYSPDDAIKAGIAMRQALNKYNKKLLKKNFQPIEFGIGVHTGACMLGIIGGEERMEGTVISDAVNLASRLESLTKRYGASFIMSKSSFSKVSNKDEYTTRNLGKVKVVGRMKGEAVVEILDAESDVIREKKLRSKKYLESGLQLYYAKKFPKATQEFLAALREYPEDKVAKLYLAQCAILIEQGVPEQWDGTDIADTK